MDKRPYDNKAWLLVLPVFLIVAISAIIPLMTVVNYSVRTCWDRSSGCSSEPSGSSRC